jgi:hypothetical protein
MTCVLQTHGFDLWRRIMQLDKLIVGQPRTPRPFFLLLSRSCQRRSTQPSVVHKPDAPACAEVPEYWLQRGQYKLEKDFFPGAEKDFDRVIELDADFVRRATLSRSAPS